MAKVPRSYDKEWQDILHGSVIHGGGYEIRVLIRGELPFLVVLVTLCGFEFGGDAWLSRLDNPLVAALLFAYSFIAMVLVRPQVVLFRGQVARDAQAENSGEK